MLIIVFTEGEIKKKKRKKTALNRARVMFKLELGLSA